MKIRYCRDQMHNYLEMEIEETEVENYQYKMLENNRIEGIIQQRISRMDGDIFLQYEIDARQSLINRYSNKKMDYEKSIELLRAYVKAAKRLGDYFLDESHLIIDTECIFEELSTGNFSFLYYPGKIEKTKSLGEILLETGDLSDERISLLAYKLCDILDGMNVNSSLIVKELLLEIEKTETKEEQFSENENDFEDTYDEDEDFEEERRENRIIMIRLPSKVSILLSILFLLVAGALYYLRIAYILTFEENILDLAVLMVAVMMSLICLLQGIKKKKYKNRKDEEYTDDEDEDEYNNDTSVIGTSETQIAQNGTKGQQNDEDDYTDDDETVLLNFDFGNTSHKLYSLDGKENIRLDSLPLTIGKKEEYADVILKESTVSRLHARIFRNGDDMLLQDLNSRNGTYLNGKRLQPNEKAVIIPEDEIAFGKCCFSYR